MAEKAKRYASSIEFYVYANSDDEAKEFIDNLCSFLDRRFDNKARPKTLTEIPFGSLDPRKVEVKIAHHHD